MAETALESIRMQIAASELIKAKMRLSIVQSLTGFTIRPLRALWIEIHGEGAKNGKLPESVLSFLVNQPMAAAVSTFISLHLRDHDATGPLNVHSLMSTWRTYQKLCGPLDINAAYYALRDLRVDFVSFPKRTSCGVHFIYDPGSTLTSRCPFCGHAPAKDEK